MKKFIALLVCAAAVTAACGILGNVAPTPEEAAQTAKDVDKALDSRKYQVDINYMIPLRAPGKALTDSNAILVDGEKFNSYLPYFGRATDAPYGGGVGLNFEEKIREYKDEGWKKDKRVITIKVNNGEDTYTYILTVYNNGSANLDVNATNRDSISFSGSLRTETEEEE